MAPDIFLKPLAPYVAGKWELGYGGWYIHRGRVYLQGELRNGSPPVGTTLLTGLPPNMRPSASTAITLISAGLVNDPATPGVVPAEEFPAHIHPDGTLTLDALPPYVNEAPPGEHFGSDNESSPEFPNFAEPLEYDINLGNVSWPVAPLADAFPTASLAPFLGPDFTDIDSVYGIYNRHPGSRIHLGGRIRAAKDGAAVILGSLFGPPTYPPEATPGNEEGGSPAGYTTVKALGRALCAFIRPNFLSLPLDGVLQGLRRHKSEGASDGRFVGGHPVGPNTLPGNPLKGEAKVEYGTLDCVHFIGKPSLECESDFNQAAALAISGLCHLDVSAALLNWSPTPQWFQMSISILYQAQRGVGHCPQEGASEPPAEPAEPGCIKGEFEEAEAEAEATRPTFTYIGPNAGEWAYIIEKGVGPPGPAWDDEATHLASGPILRTDGKGFTGQVGLAPNTLWKPGELTGFDLTFGGLAAHLQLFGYTVTITPYWLTRDLYLRAGDIVDLTGAGWQAAGGIVNIGAGRDGVLASLPNHGKRG